MLGAGAIFFAERQLETFVLRVDRHIAELAAALVADRDLSDEPVEYGVEEHRDDQDDHAQVKALTRRRECEKRDGGDDDNRQAEFLGEILADEKIAAAAGGTFVQGCQGGHRRCHQKGNPVERTRYSAMISPTKI